jgi:hypothetical protein
MSLHLPTHMLYVRDLEGRNFRAVGERKHILKLISQALDAKIQQSKKNEQYSRKNLPLIWFCDFTRTKIKT